MQRLKLQHTPDQIEQDFLDALKRLQDGEPTDKSLRRDKKAGVLKITSTNVALEAGRSRTLISMTNCRYPRIRELIKQAKGDRSFIPTTQSELIRRLRTDISELRVQRDQYQAEATVHFLARVKAEKAAAREKEIAARLRKDLASSNNVSTLDKIK